MNPPGHAEHKWSVQDGMGRSVGFMSLSYCLTASYTPQYIKDAAAKLLADNPGTYTEEWEKSCYAYWRNCYSPDGVDRVISNLEIKKDGDPEKHAAYLHIKKYFLEAKPRLDLIQDPPKWGVS